ncbi:hypothetical protein Cgig2_013730 [Carnegiea gigantea]|uniref:Ubiquitin-like protease family profile domain-containing protein n=1 Tax=Carnegiea gigantea TaxID=171969 RepID=A0A9Q1JW67_9CARY|nr:hypothetical protein Cgig2_013730 [Carnegiea gigantea]
MRGMKGGTKGLKSTAIMNTGSGHRSPSTMHGDVVNNEGAISVVPIAVVPAEGEVDAHADPDAAPKDDVPDTTTFGPSPHVPAPRTRGTGSKFVICEEGVKAYLTWTLSPTELDLLTAVRARCKGLKDNQWQVSEFLKGLINVVSTRGAAGRPGRYCIGSFAVHQYYKLLDFRQCEHKTYCRMSVFLDRHDQGLLNKPEHAARDIWEMLKAQKDSNLCYVFLPLFESVSQHWLLLVADVNNRRFIVAIGHALMKLAEFTDVLKWEMEHADCPQQDNGHDCGVYMLTFMDLLSIRADGLYFGQPYVRQTRDKLLLSLLQGNVAHFPQAFLQGT